MDNSYKTILSLFDYTGNWSLPYKEAGYNVIRHDILLGQDIFDDTIPSACADMVEGNPVHGILAAVPCTDFASSGARWWGAKEKQEAPYTGKNLVFENRLDYFVTMVYTVLLLVEWFKPEWWVIENPRGRIRKLVPEIGEPKLVFNPCDFGDPYTKETFLYGDFNPKLTKEPALPLYGSLMHKMGSNHQGKRSVTPMGFSRAFYNANQ